MNRTYTGLRIPIHHANDSDLINLPMPDACGRAIKRRLAIGMAGFAACATALAHFADKGDRLATWALFAGTTAFILLLADTANYEENALHRIVRKMEVVERPVTVDDDFDGYSISTGSISSAVEMERYFVLRTANDGRHVFAYVAPKAEMTDAEVELLREILERNVERTALYDFPYGF